LGALGCAGAGEGAQGEHARGVAWLCQLALGEALFVLGYQGQGLLRVASPECALGFCE
jgi:hypothetical protein